MFTMTLVTPEKKIETQLPVEEVVVPAYRGYLTLLPGHAPLMTTLDVGILKYKPQGSNEFKSAAISWGYLEVVPHGLNILAETAETKEDIDVPRVEAALKKANQALLSGTLDPEAIEKNQRKLKRAQVRIEIAKS